MIKIIINPIDGADIKVFEILRDRFSIDEIYAIENEATCRKFQQSSLMNVVAEEYMHLDIFNAKYEGYLFYNEMAPLDQEIFDKMAQYEPEALKMLERAGRVNDSAERRFMQYHTHVRYWNYFLDRTTVDCFIAGSAPHCIYDYIIMRLCQIKEIPVIQMEMLPFQSCLKKLFYKHYEDFDMRLANEIKRYKAEFQNNSDKRLSERMQREYDLFTGTKERIFVTSPSQKGMLKARIRFFKLLWKRDKGNALSRAVKHFTDQSDTRRLLRKYEKMTVTPDYKKRYIYFPLQYQPERSTSPAGGWFVHQYLAIEKLSYYLPDDAVIYVKEHPRMKETLPVHTRILEHYKRIDKLKNVFLLPIDTSTVELADHAVAVATITGHIGYEALFKKKPLLMFGHSVMKYAPHTFNIRTNEDCRNALDKIFREGIQIEDADIKAFLTATDEASVELFDEKRNPNYDKEESIKEIVRVFSDMFREIMRF